MIEWSSLPTVRLIVDSDAKNEADDQFAIVHALLTPTFDVRGLVPAHFGCDPERQSTRRSRDEMELLLSLLGRRGTVPILDGAERPLADADDVIDCPGARAMIEESAKPGRLAIAVLGPLTTVASALRLDPELAERDVEIIWIGGGSYRDVVPMCWPCFNLANDRHAANVVFGSGVRIRQIPMDVYQLVWVGYAELAARVAPHGAIGRYLVDQLVAFNRDCHRLPIDGRTLGDSPAIGVAMNPDIGLWREQAPVQFDEEFRAVPGGPGRSVLVCEQLDVRYLLEDLFAKLALFGAGDPLGMT